MNVNMSELTSSKMAEMEEKVQQYKAYLSKSFENPKEEKILYVFKKLDRLNITLEVLQDTGIGKVVNSYRKHDGPIGEKTRQLVGKWKQLVSSASAAAASSTSSEKESVSQPGLQCETVSETTYGSHSGRVMHRLDEVVKAPYMDSEVKVEPGSVRVKDEPKEDRKSRSSSDKSHKDKHRAEAKIRKREKSPENGDAERNRKKQKLSDVGESLGGDFNLTRVKKEKTENDMEVRVKKELEDRGRSHVGVKEEKRSPTTSPLRSKHHCDNVQNKDKPRESSGKSSSQKGPKDHHHKSGKTSESSKDKYHKDKSKDGSSSSSSNTQDKVRSKSEPSRKDLISSASSSSSSNKVKVKSEPVDRDMSPHPDFENVKIKKEPVSHSSSKSRKSEQSHSEKHSGSSSKTGHSSERTSKEKSHSHSKDKSSSKSGDSKDRKHGEKKHSSSSSKPSRSSSKGSSSSKVQKPVEFDMFSMPNGLGDESEGEDNGASFDDMLTGDAQKKKPKEAVVVKKEKPGTTYSISSKKLKPSGPPRAKLPTSSVPQPRQPVSLSQDEILGALPEITPNYKPLPHVDLDDMDSKEETQLLQADVGSKKNCRTLVYSGRRNVFLTAVPTLYNACIQVLKDNIDALDYVGGVPYDIMKPVLEIATPAQLYNIEDANPQFIGETDELWKEHCKKDFRNKKSEEFETAREMYIRCHDARDAKLKVLTASIAASVQKAKAPVRTAKLAYVDTVAKAPRDVARRQRIHGTAGPMGKHDPLMKLSSHRAPGKPQPRQPIARGIDANHSVSLGRNRSEKPVKVIAPMMRKTLRFMKSLKRK